MRSLQRRLRSRRPLRDSFLSPGFQVKYSGEPPTPKPGESAPAFVHRAVAQLDRAQASVIQANPAVAAQAAIMASGSLSATITGSVLFDSRT
jgi:hypothetical protein